MLDCVIKARYIVSFHQDQPLVIENGMIGVDGNTITELGKSIDISGKEVFNFPNHVILPGLVNTHTHSAMTLFRGYADDVSLQKWLNEHIWPLEAKLTEEQVYFGAKLAAVEAILSGSTTLNSMYWHPESEAKAFAELGVRFMIGTPIISGVSNLSMFDNLITNWHEKDGDMTRVALTPHAPYTVTADDYTEIHDFKVEYNKEPNHKNLVINTHLAEDKNEMDLIRNFSQTNGFDLPDGVKSPTQYLQALGVLDENLIAAHCIEMTTDDFKILAKEKVGIATNTVSNMKLGNNLPKIKEMLEYTNKIGMGTDGPCSNNGLDLFETMKITAITQKSINSNPAVMPAWASLKMATYGGAKVLGWNDSIGSIQVGKKADFTIVNLNKPYFLPVFKPETVLSHIVYSATGNDVSDVMINGEWRMRDRIIQNIDLSKLLDQFKNSVNELVNS
ncbi:MAG: amidohydrolase [Candidatus Kariarchaeaceae archaeon]|jgi:5-methylthioadenosine/S-adenosylhomocysteine deaminase